jgi:hypothetical protein
MKPLRYFQISEFDSPDQPGSGSKMDPEFLRMLDQARHHSGIPYRITSGYRSREYQNDLRKRGYPTAKNSAHLNGFAADIAASTSHQRMLILQGLILAKFNRIGISRTFVHVDDDPSKSPDVCWIY